jgi:hypothetical protein
MVAGIQSIDILFHSFGSLPTVPTIGKKKKTSCQKKMLLLAVIGMRRNGKNVLNVDMKKDRHERAYT